MTRDELVEKMCEADYQTHGHFPDWFRVAVDAYEQALSEVIDGALQVMTKAQIIAAVRAKLEKPKSAEERVTLKEISPGLWNVMLDGKLKCWFQALADAEIYIKGLIAQLKEAANA